MEEEKRWEGSEKRETKQNKKTRKGKSPRKMTGRGKIGE